MVSHSSGSASDRRPGEPGRRHPAPDGADAGTTAHAALADPMAAEPAAMRAVEAIEAEQGLSVDDELAGAWELVLPEDTRELAGDGSFAEAEAVAETETDDRAGAEGSAGAGDSAGSLAKASESKSQRAPEVPADSAAEALVEAALTVRPNRRAQAARLAFLALTLAAGAYAVARQWGRVRAGFEELGPLPLVLALLPALASVGAMMLAWRGLLGSLGSPLRLRPAARIFFTSQLGKYLPGSVWPVVAQMQLGRAHRIPRARSAAAAALAMLVSLVTALVLAAVTLSVAGGARAAGYWWAFAAVPVLLAGLHPRVANPALKTIFRVTRRPAIEPLTGATIRETAGRSLVGWLFAGAHIWVLAVALGADPWRALLLGVGGYAFAWSVGFLIVFAPAGAGVRELILVAALQPVLDSGEATVVALASRLVTIVADLVAAALTAREGGRAPEPDTDLADGAADTPDAGADAVRTA